MANLRFRSLAAVPFKADGDRVKVGHNRTVERVESDGVVAYVFRLHGHAVATLRTFSDGGVALFLDSCGYLTVTTRQAMKDALSLFGLRGGVSMAGGKLSADIFRYSTDCERRAASADSALEFFFRNGSAAPYSVVAS